jgi:hypothetical protein
MLLVATAGDSAVYESFGSWPKCLRWMKHLSRSGVSSHDLSVVKKLFERYQYATFAEVTASTDDLESQGYRRVDR